METFRLSGPAEILRSVQKDKILFELMQKHMTNLFLKIGGTSMWLRHRQFIDFSSKFLYYCFTTLSGFQTLGEEYTNIIQVDESLRYTPSFLRRLFTVVLEIGGLSFIEYSLNKFQRKVHENTLLHEQFRQRLLFFIRLLKALLPFCVHLHLIIFYWNGKFYNLSKRITGIQYITAKPWIKNYRMYGFKILATISLLHLSISVLSFLYKWFITPVLYEPSPITNRSQTTGNCSLCLEPRTYPSLTTCGHLFCWYCIFEWLQTSNRCPICRDIIHPSRVIPLRNYL